MKEKLFRPLGRKLNKERGNHAGLRLPLSNIQSQETKKKCLYSFKAKPARPQNIISK